ncbi:hypothetical protein ACVMFA_009982 [Bradyrhizobium liaoningense]|nr:hypothetical protein GCM10007858_12160 [Bradyrhizobium liaoningense]
MRQRRLHDQADPGTPQHQQERDEDDHRYREHEYLVGGIVGGEDREGREVKQRRHAIVDRAPAPDHCDDLFDRECEAKGQQQFRDMAMLVRVAQSVALDRHADRADQERGEHESRPEPDPFRQLKAEEGAEHVEAGMGEVEHAHHAEDDR